MNPRLFWWIDSDEFFLPETFYQSDDLMARVRDVFSELHYNRRTFYPLHDWARIDRDWRTYCLTLAEAPVLDGDASA